MTYFWWNHSVLGCGRDRDWDRDRDRSWPAETEPETETETARTEIETETGTETETSETGTETETSETETDRDWWNRVRESRSRSRYMPSYRQTDRQNTYLPFDRLYPFSLENEWIMIWKSSIVEKRTYLMENRCGWMVRWCIPSSEVMTVPPPYFSRESRKSRQLVYLALWCFDSQCTDVELTKNGNISQLFHAGKRNIGGCRFYHSREHVQVNDDLR